MMRLGALAQRTSLRRDRVKAWLTMEEVLADQEDLGALCSAVALNTREPFAPNAFYGMDRILKAYAGLPAWYGLKAVVPHGVVLNPAFVWEREAKSHLPVVLCYPDYRADTYRARTPMRVELAASPFVYLQEMLPRFEGERTGTIVFPVHSTHHLTAKADYGALADELIALPPEFHPIEVCIYWRDYELGHHRAFESRGLSVVSAGHIFDPDFLVRFSLLCSRRRFAASNGVGSYIPYSLAAGCEFLFVGAEDFDLVGASGMLNRDASLSVSELTAMRQRHARELEHGASHYIERYLGGRHLLSPRALRRLLLSAELEDKTRITTRRIGGRSLPVPPTAVTRVADRALGLLRGAARRLTPSRDS